MSNRRRRYVKKLIRRIVFIVNIILVIALAVMIAKNTELQKKIKNMGQAVMKSESSRSVEGSDKKQTKEDSEDYISTDKLMEFADMYRTGSKSYTGYTVCLDAGHGGTDIGAESEDGTYEKYDTLKLARLVKAYLESVGVNVVMTRENDKEVTLEERKNIAESCNADLMLSLHRNIYEGTQDINGVEAWISNTEPEGAKRIAENILEQMEENVSGVNNRGVKCGTMDNVNENYAVNKVSMDSMILEVGFMSSSHDNKLYNEFLDGFAVAIAKGVLESIE